MPKSARKYYYPEYENYSYKSYYGYNTQNITELNRFRHTKNKKNNKTARFILSCAIMLFVAFIALPYSFSNIMKCMFNPSPYGNIKTDMRNLAFPSVNYLSNNWFMGNRFFSFSASGNKAQMIGIKENVSMPVLTNNLLSLMQEYTKISPSIYVWDYETGNYTDIGANKIYSTASIIKVPVLVDLFKSIEAGQLSLDDKMTLTEYYRTEGSGSLQFKAQNSQWRIDDLARLMITESDNSATNMIMSKLGSMTDVNSSIRMWGLKNTEVQTWLPDYNGNNHTTAREMAQIFYNIESNDKFLSETSKEKILDYMGHVHNDRLIQAGLGNGSKFYHKTGDIGSMLGDAGIVITPNGKKYIVVILVNRPHNYYLAKDFIVKASEMIYNYMVK